MSSIKPNDDCREVYSTEEISCGLVVAGCYGSELLEFSEEIFDQMASFVDLPVELPWDLSVGFGRNDGELAGRREGGKDPLVGIIRLVREERVRLHAREQRVGSEQIMGLARREVEADRIAQSINQSMDFGAQTAAGSSDRLVFANFFFAPALC